LVASVVDFPSNSRPARIAVQRCPAPAGAGCAQVAMEPAARTAAAATVRAILCGESILAS